MEKVYLETTFLSYLVSQPSRDLIVAAHQQTTQDWWSHQRAKYDCVISPFVIDEISQGDPEEVRKRMKIAENLSVLEILDETENLAGKFIENGIIPIKAAADAAHIAMASVHQIDYVLTWNCRHLANARILKRLRAVCKDTGYELPDVCTPEALMGVEND